MKDRSELTPEDIAMLCGAFPKGATRARLAEFGIPWPPPGGWRKKLKSITALPITVNPKRPFGEITRKLAPNWVLSRMKIPSQKNSE